MAVNINKIIQVNDKVIAPQQTGLSLTMLWLTSNGRIPSSYPAINFDSLDLVESFFGMNSDEYNIAKVYFKGFDGSQKKPSFITFAKLMNEDGNGWLAGNVPATIEQFQAVTSGTFNITVLDISGSSIEHDIVNINLSGKNSYSEIAAAISLDMVNSGLHEYDVVYDSSIQRFVLQGLGTGENSKIVSVNIATTGTDLAPMLAMLPTDNPIKSDGYIAKNGTENMELIESYFKDFVSFSVVQSTVLDFQVSLATWCSSKGTRFVYIPYTTDVRVLSPNDSTQIAYLCSDLSGIAPIYGTSLIASFFGSIGACIDYEQNNGVITFALKKQSGLKTVIDNTIEYDNILNNGYNTYAIFGNVSSEYKFTQPGKITGNYLWIDAYYNQVWLKDMMVNKIAVLMQNNKRIPFSQQGFQIVQATIENVLDLGLNNGCIESQIQLDQDVIDQINQEAGRVISTVLFSKGYFISIKEPTQVLRTSRQLPQCDVWYTYSGAIHYIELDLIQIQ
ncbi:MAG: DUF3383 family protein [Cetobacterium sp.]